MDYGMVNAKSKKYYIPPENCDFSKSKFKSYWAFLWLLNCSDNFRDGEVIVENPSRFSNMYVEQ